MSNNKFQTPLSKLAAGSKVEPNKDSPKPENNSNTPFKIKAATKTTKILIIILELCGVLAASGMEMIIAVIGDVGVTLLAILNSLRIFYYNYGRKKQEKPTEQEELA